jgi:hypothetical protein
VQEGEFRETLRRLLVGKRSRYSACCRISQEMLSISCSTKCGPAHALRVTQLIASIFTLGKITVVLLFINQTSSGPTKSPLAKVPNSALGPPVLCRTQLPRSFVILLAIAPRCVYSGQYLGNIPPGFPLSQCA